MKKHIFLPSVMALSMLSSAAFAEDVEVENFESEEFIQAMKFQNGELVPAVNETWGGVDKLLAIEENPDQGGINDSYYAAYAIRSGGGDKNFQAEFNIEPQNVSGIKYIHVMVYKPKHSSLQISGRQNQPETGNPWDDRFIAPAYYYTEGQNGWVDVVFKVDFGVGIEFDRLCLQLDMVNPAGRYEEYTKIYFDEIIINDTPQPRGDNTNYPVAKTLLPENFEGSTTIADKLYFGNYMYWNTTDKDLNLGLPLHAVVDNPDKASVNSSEKVLKLVRKKEATWWSRVRFVLNEGNGVQITAANRYVHLFLKKELASKVSLFVTTLSGKNYEWISPIEDYTGGDWQNLVFELPDELLNQTIRLLQINPHSTDLDKDMDIYIDDLRFSDSPIANLPIIHAQSEVDFGGAPSGQNKEMQISFSGQYLTSDISLEVSGEGFSLANSQYPKEDVTQGATATIRFTPTQEGKTYQGVLKFVHAGNGIKTVALVGESMLSNRMIDIDFENGSFPIADGNNYSQGGLDGILDICDNPDVSGLNVTSKVAYLVKTPQGDHQFSANLELQPLSVDGKKYIHVLVHKPSHSLMTLALRNSQKPGKDIYSARSKYYVSDENEWVDAVFEIDFNGYIFDEMILNLDHCSSGDRYESNTQVYFDQIILNDDPMPRGVSTAPIAPKTSFPESFGNAHNVANPLYFGQTYEWIGEESGLNTGRMHEQLIANPAPEDGDNGSQNVLQINRKSDAVYWSRMRFNLMPAIEVNASNRYFHVMINKAADAELAAHFFNSAGQEQAWVRSTEPYIGGEWQDVIFLIPEDFGDVVAVDINPHSTGSDEDLLIYVDELEINDNPERRYITLDNLNQKIGNPVKIYSANSSLCIESLESGAQVRVVSLNGVIVNQQYATGENLNIKLERGIFMVQIINNQKVSTHKVVIR